jgi:hypothetical protein
MAATMHNQDDNRQSLNEDSLNPAAPSQDPSWLKPVKIAMVVMGVLIVLCLGLLGYGFYVGVGKLSSQAAETFTYPEEATLLSVSHNDDGTMLLRFQMDADTDKLIVIDPASKRILRQITLQSSDRFGFSE